MGRRSGSVALLSGCLLLAGSVAVTLGSARWRSCAGDPLPASEKVVVGLLGGAVLAVFVGGSISATRGGRSRRSVAASSLLWLLTVGAIVAAGWLAAGPAYGPCGGGLPAPPRHLPVTTSGLFT